MPSLVIDGRSIEVAAGTTLLSAAAGLGIQVPTLCHLRDEEPLAACMVCLVEESASGRLLPACATRAEQGMRIETASERARVGRRTALELLLSDHAGDCEAPCERACPLHLDIAGLLDRVQSGDIAAAWTLLRDAVPLPATAARLCRGGCEKACRRRRLDEPVHVPQLHARVAAWGLANAAEPRRLAAPSGRRLSIIGAGAAGLAAADVLLARGHACTIFDEREVAGESLRQALAGDRAALEQLGREIDAIVGAGAVIHAGVRVGVDVSTLEALAESDLLLVATEHPPLGLEPVPGRTVLTLPCETRSAERSAPHSLARGRDLGLRAHALLVGDAPPANAAPAVCAQMTALTRDELLALHANRQQRLGRTDLTPASGRTGDPALALEASRCLGCSCQSASSCALRRVASEHQVEPRRFRGARRAVERAEEHTQVRYEPGKCILCGRCTRLAESAGEPLGLGLVGRGLGTRVRVPFERPLAESLARCARACAAACPTGALSLEPDAAHAHRGGGAGCDARAGDP